MKFTFVPIAPVAILLTGCSSPTAAPATDKTTSPATSTPAPKASASKSPTAKATASAKPATSREDQIKAVFLESVRKSQPGLSSAEDEGLVTITQGFCKMYDGGAKDSDVNDYILTAAGWAYTVPQRVAVHGSAVGHSALSTSTK